MRSLVIVLILLAACEQPSAIDAGHTGSAGDASVLSRDASTPSGDAGQMLWNVLRPEVAEVELSLGGIEITMLQMALWFENQQSVFVYQDVEGDFSLQAIVRARRTSSPTEAPNAPVHLGGLMARNPHSPQENYVFIVVGYDENDLSVETKSTQNGVSSFDGPEWPSGDAELRLCRVGSEFRMYKRGIGSVSWQLAAAVDRPDLPTELQVGANAYALTGPDLRVQFSELVLGAGCKN